MIQVVRYSILILFVAGLAACSGASGGDAAGDLQNPSQQPAGEESDGGGGGSSDPRCGPMTGASCEVFLAVNAARTGQGLAALGVHSRCVAEAEAHAQDMVVRNFFAHDSPTETTAQRFARFGLAGSYWGENIAGGYSSAGQVMQGWMNSSGHRANILGAQFLSMGVGVAVNSQGTRYWVQCFSGMSPNN